MAETLLDRNRPRETVPEEELGALREEYECIQHAGHARRQAWVVIKFQKDATDLALGKISDERLRAQAEGRCQAFKSMMDRDDEVREAWQEHVTEGQEKGQREELEGGDHGVHYEASK